MPMLRDLLVGLELGMEETSGNLKLTYVRRTGLGGTSPGYILAAEGFETGLLKVTEVDPGGHVPELLADSQAELACLLLGGEELIGAKQNRILNVDILLRPHGKSRIPVACVEQGRWHYTREDFEVGLHAPASIRGRQSRSVRRSLEASATPQADQGEVWDCVEGFLACLDTPSETMAMSDAYQARESDIDGLVKGFTCPEDAVGVIATIDGKFAACDLFDRPGTLKKVWPRLMMGYAADAVMRKAMKRASGGQGAPFNVLDRLGSQECTVSRGVDLGDDWRFESQDLVGSALVLYGTALHMSAFPVNDDPADEGNPGLWIVGPIRHSGSRRM